MLAGQSIIADIKAIIEQSKDKAVRAVDHQRPLMYWHIGKRIFGIEERSIILRERFGKCHYHTFTRFFIGVR